MGQARDKTMQRSREALHPEFCSGEDAPGRAVPGTFQRAWVPYFSEADVFAGRTEQVLS